MFGRSLALVPRAVRQAHVEVLGTVPSALRDSRGEVYG